MNIGIVTAWYPSGAGYVSKAYRETLEIEHTVFIYARSGQNKKGDSNWDDQSVTWAPGHYSITGIWPNHFKKWIRKNKIDIIIFNEQRHWAPILLAKDLGIIVGAYIDYYTQKTIYNFEVYDFLVCNTKRHFSAFSWHKNCFYIPWGTDINKYKPNNNYSDRPITFIVSLGVESINDRRGARLAIKAFLKVKGNCKLIVCSQTKKENCSKDFIEDVYSDNRIEVRYGTFEPFPFWDGDIFVYPSRLEGIGLALPEALSCGLAAIATNAAPMNEFVIDDLNGLLIDVEKFLGTHHGYYWAESICNIDSITSLMQRYVEDPELLKSHKVQARHHALKKLNWAENSKELLKVVCDVDKLEINITDKLRERIIETDNLMNPNIIQKWKEIFKSTFLAIFLWFRSIL